MNITTIQKKYTLRRGIALIAAMIFVVIFSAISIGFLSLSSANTQLAANHRAGGNAMNAALSGLDCARYIIATVSKNNKTNKTVIATVNINSLTTAQAETQWYSPMWTALCTQLASTSYGGTVEGPVSGTIDGKTLYKIAVSNIAYNDNDKFSILFSRYANDPNVYVSITGTEGSASITRNVRMTTKITPESTVLNYGIAGRGRVWLAGDVTVHGSIYSAYGYKTTGALQSLSPFNMTTDSTVEGSLNTILPWQEITDAGYYDMQTFAYDTLGNLVLDDGKYVSSSGYLIDAYGNYVRNSSGSYVDVFSSDFVEDNGIYTVVNSSGVAILDSSGNPITYGGPVEAFDDDGNRIYSTNDELQGVYDTVNYDVPDNSNIPGLSIGDYYNSSGQSLTEVTYKNNMTSTTVSASGTTISSGTLSKSGVTTTTEYFPHASGSYTTAASSSSLKLTRYTYTNKVISDVIVSAGTNALFDNCTFNGILYINCSTSGPTYTNSSTFNNVRFNNCTFNGTIITNVPKALNTNWWMANSLYFTGSATFNNQSSVQEATILAPHFNVNLGNTNADTSNNTLTGAIVGGIVDIRGNADIFGTIISMANTASYTSGYVSNIGATLNDGGSETTDISDIGTITITPDPTNLLPSGITTPIVFETQVGSYAEYF